MNLMRRIVTSTSSVLVTATVAVMLAVTGASGGPLAIDSRHNLLDPPHAGAYDSIFGSSAAEATVAADSYGADPLVQDGASAFYSNDLSGMAHSFDMLGESLGSNLAGNAGDSYALFEAESILGNGNTLIQVEIAALDASSTLTPWVAAGTTGPNGPFTSWRMDVGSGAALNDPIDQLLPVTIVNAGVIPFDSTGTALGTFGLLSTSSTPTSLDGIAVLDLGGADIAGFDLASMQLFWEVRVVPEPATLSLLGLGSLAMLLSRRRSAAPASRRSIG